MIYLPGLINIDFADLKMVLEGEGPGSTDGLESKIAYLNSVKAGGLNRAEEAVEKVLFNPLSEYNIRPGDSAHSSSFCLIPERILFNITASRNLKMKEVEQISRTISDYNSQAKIIFGVSHNKNYQDKLRITLLATGRKKTDTVKARPLQRRVPTPKFGSEGRIGIPSRPKEESFNGTKERVSQKPKSLVLLPASSEVQAPESKPTPSDLPVLAKKSAKTAVRKPLKAKKKPKIKKRATKKHKKSSSSRPVKLPSARSDNAGILPKPKEELFNGADNEKHRRNALDLKRETEQAEQKILLEEKKWDIPAFLRRRRAEEL